MLAIAALESDEDAERALDLCKGDEDLAAERLTEGAAQFMAAIRKTVKSRSAEVAVPSTSAAGSALDGGPGMPAPACSPSPREPDSVVRRTPQTEAAHEMPWRSSRSARVPIRRVGRPEYEECAVFVGAFQSRPRTGGGAQRGGDATPGNQAAEDGGAGQADAPPCGALASDPTCSPGLEVGAPTATKHVPMESPDESPSTRGQGASAAQQGGRSTLRGTAGARPASSKRRRESRVGLSISSGKGSLGRTRRGSVKRAEVLHLGELRTGETRALWEGRHGCMPSVACHARVLPGDRTHSVTPSSTSPILQPRCHSQTQRTVGATAGTSSPPASAPARTSAARSTWTPSACTPARSSLREGPTSHVPPSGAWGGRRWDA